MQEKKKEIKKKGSSTRDGPIPLLACGMESSRNREKSPFPCQSWVWASAALITDTEKCTTWAVGLARHQAG